MLSPTTWQGETGDERRGAGGNRRGNHKGKNDTIRRAH